MRIVVQCLRYAGLILAVVVEAADRSSYQQAFVKDVLPLLQSKCMDCHDQETRKGDVSLKGLGPDMERDPAALAMWGRVLEQLEVGIMPPGDKPQPTARERADAVAWIHQGMTRAGMGFAVKARLLLPEYGNRVSHQLLFDGSIKYPPYTPARLWRISPHIYRGKRYQSVVRGGIEAEPVSYVSRASGIRDYASQEVMDEAGFLALRMALGDIIASQMHDRELPGLSYGPNKGKPIRIPGKDTFKAISEAQGEPSEEAMAQVVREEFDRAFGRPVTEAEFARYLAFMKQSIAAGGNEPGLKTALLSIYLSTGAVYRMELGRGEPDAQGRRMLAPQEIAFALAYALTDEPPARDPIIKKALESGRLRTQADVEVVVREMLAAGSPPIRRNLPAAAFYRMVQEAPRGYGYYPRVVRFFEEFFQYPRAAATFKDSPGQAIGTRALVGAPQGHIVRIVNEDKRVFESLLTSSRFNMSKARLLPQFRAQFEARLKKLPKERHADAIRDYDKVARQADQLRDDSFRAGILHDHSWLIAHSTNDQNDPVHRGIWIRERLLAGNLPALPIGVDANVPEAHDRTLRQRFVKTKAAECWKCHKYFEPLGWPFESFTDRGWVRTGLYYDKKRKTFHEELKPEQIEAGLRKVDLVEYPWDTTGEITGTGEPGIDGPVKDARDLVLRLARSTRVRQSFIRHAFRYWMGRNEMLSDSQTLITADQAYVRSGGKFSEVLVSLLTSDSFLYRK